MIVLGIAGGIASGKSHVAKMFESLGASVLDGDAIGHEVMVEPEVIEQAKRRWGSHILGVSGALDRKAIAAHVFGADAKAVHELEFWESVVHPLIAARLQAKLEEIRNSGRTKVAVLDAAVMFKSGWHRHCDRIVFIEVPEETRRQRARQRGWTDAQFTAREGAQTSVDEKRRIADFVIDNSGTFDQTYEQVRTLWSTLSLGNSPPP